MRVIRVTEFGGPEVLTPGEAPDPVAGPGEAVIAVSAADVLFLDTQIRSGSAAGYFAVKPPYVPGNGVAGRVVSVGPGVDPGWAGRRVVTRTGGPGGQGGYAEMALAPADGLVQVPDSLGLSEAAALLHDGPTALGLAERARLEPGDWALVLGAAGGLGILLVQLARAAGARVVGAARGKQKLDLIREFGADAVADYSEQSWLDRVCEVTGGAGPDVVFDGVGGQVGLAAFGITARGGQFSAHGAASGAFTEADRQQADQRRITVRGIDQVQFAAADLKRLAGRALSDAVAGKIKPVIGQTVPLQQAAAAHAAMEARSVIGKSLLLI
jgi:NADPH:quinone reductase